MVQILWLLIAAALLAVTFLLRGWLAFIVGAILAALAIGWVLCSVLWPSAPDRRCPACRQPGLVKLRRGEPGVRCELCGFIDREMHVAYLDDW